MAESPTPPEIEEVKMPVNPPLIDLLDIEQISSGRTPIDIVGSDPNFHYTWLDRNPVNLERMKMMFGYEIVGEDDKVASLIPPNASGERVFGTLVLAKIARHRWDKLEKMRETRTAESVQIPNEAWKEAAREAGLLVSDTTKVTKREGI